MHIGKSSLGSLASADPTTESSKEANVPLDLSPAMSRTTRLKSTIVKKWPIATSSSATKTGIQLTVTMDDIYRVYGKDEDPVKLFDKASSWLKSMQNSPAATNSNKRAEIIEKQLRHSMVRAIFGSNQIERAGLNEDETTKLCERVFQGEDLGTFDERTPGYEKKLLEELGGQAGSKIFEGQTLKSYIRGRHEVVNHAKALQYMIDRVVSLDLPITDECIKTTHRILCGDTPIHHSSGAVTLPRDYAGIYRDKGGLFVGAGNTMFTPPHMVPAAMAKLVAELKTDLEVAQEKNSIDPFALASKLSMNFVQIHPFQDGNGRMCRILLNTILCKYAGIVVPIGETEEDITEYLEIKKRASRDADDHGEYATFVLKKAVTRLRKFKQMLGGKSKA
jgi:Fic family protein